MNTNISIELQDIIQNISLVDLNTYDSRNELLEKVQYLLELKLKLNILKPKSRLSNNPNSTELFNIERKLLIKKDFHDRNFMDPIKWVMAFTPALLVSMVLGPLLGAMGLMIYVISYF